MYTLDRLRQEGLLVYKRILKLHMTLPSNFQVLGNTYLRDEFQRHHYPTTQAFSINHYYTFLNAWREYLKEMNTPEVQLFGKPLQQEDIKAMSKEQKGTLNDFKSRFRR